MYAHLVSLLLRVEPSNEAAVDLATELNSQCHMPDGAYLSASISNIELAMMYIELEGGY